MLYILSACVCIGVLIASVCVCLFDKNFVDRRLRDVLNQSM